MENQKKEAANNDDVDVAKFINTRAVVDMLGISAGMLVGDFGCGTGYFAFPLAKKVGERGQVFALDILKTKLEVVASEAKVLGLSNIITRHVNLEMVGGSKLETESLDWVFLVTMLFQNKKRNLILEESVRVLKKGGKIFVSEWNNKNYSIGPTSTLRVSKEEIFDLAKQYGLIVVEEREVSDFHFGIILEK